MVQISTGTTSVGINTCKVLQEQQGPKRETERGAERWEENSERKQAHQQIKVTEYMVTLSSLLINSRIIWLELNI